MRWVGRGHSCGVAASLTHRALRESKRRERKRDARQQPGERKKK